MTFEEAVNVHADYRNRIGKPGSVSKEEARQSILEFLGWESVNEIEFAKDVRIVLVSADFKKEITSVAIWLSQKKGVDISCVRMMPYALGDKMLVDIQQIIPLPEAHLYQVQLRRKEEERQTAATNKDFTKYDLTLKGEIRKQLSKRKLCFLVVQALSHDGVKIGQFMKYLPKKMWLCVDGEWDHEEFAAKVDAQMNALGRSSDLKRYYRQIVIDHRREPVEVVVAIRDRSAVRVGGGDGFHLAIRVVSIARGIEIRGQKSKFGRGASIPDPQMRGIGVTLSEVNRDFHFACPATKEYTPECPARHLFRIRSNGKAPFLPRGSSA